MKLNVIKKAVQEAEDYTGRKNRALINRMFRQHDQSNLWPVNNLFNVTQRAIKRLQRYMCESGHDMQGSEYAHALDNEISKIVNDPKLL